MSLHALLNQKDSNPFLASLKTLKSGRVMACNAIRGPLKIIVSFMEWLEYIPQHIRFGQYSPH